MIDDVSEDSTGVGGLITGLLLLGSSVSVAFYGTQQGTRLSLGQFRNPVIEGPLWAVLVVGAVLLTLAGTLLTLATILGLLESISPPKMRGRTSYTLTGIGGLTGVLLSCLATLLSWTLSTRLPTAHRPTRSPTVLIALAGTAIPLWIAFYRLWKPTKGFNPVRAPTPQRSPPSPDIVNERRVKESDAPTTPTPPDRFTVSGQTDQDGPDSDDDAYPPNVDLENLEYNWMRETDVSMEDVGGMNELKQSLETDVIKPLTTGKEKADAFGIPLPNIVFHGPPGTGKTYIAKALATELRLPFAKLSGADVQSKWINESAQKINTLFEEAKTVADSEGGAVVFLDELDAVLKQRDAGGSSHDEDNKVVAEFLNHLQDTSEHNILFIGATNRLEALDDAGIRAGRVDKKIYVGKPDEDAREAIVRAQLADRPNDLSDDDIREIAKRTDGLAAAELESLVVAAARSSAFERDAEMVEWPDIVQVLEQKSTDEF